MTTFARSAANSLDVASPMPRAPPVTIATLPASRPISSLLRVDKYRIIVIVHQRADAFACDPQHHPRVGHSGANVRFVINYGLGNIDHGVPIARAAEAAGFTSLGIPDSFFYPKHSDSRYPYTPDGGRTFIEHQAFLDPC